MSNFIKAEQGLKHSVIYTDKSGKYFRFSGGTWAWRNHNPGNVVPGKISKKNHQIGVAGGFAVFPDYKCGHKALLDALRKTFYNMSIDQLVDQYAPPHENNTVVYKKFLHKKTGVLDDRKIKNFTPGEFKKLWQAIEQMEGSKEGKISEIYQIIHVQKNKNGTIDTYDVDPIGWVSKEECIKLAKLEKLDVVVCTTQSGKVYLRSRPDSSVEDNFDNLDDKKRKK